MDIVRKYKQNGYFTAELFHLLSKKKITEAQEEITPSEYEKELKMSTAERLSNLNSIVIENIVVNGQNKKQAILSFVPRIIIFQNFTPNEKVVAKFSVKNISTAPTYLKMVFKESSYFSIKLNRDQPLSRLAPGMNVSFSITFMPTQMEDYIHKIIFYTDMDQYVVPVIAVGPRPMFNFPDKITIPKVPLKVESTFSLIVRNIGMVSSGFTLDTKCPFSVEPKSAFLHCDEKIEIKITFKTMHLGSAQGVLRVTFETGEILKVQLSGTAHAVALELEKQVIRVTETYNGLVRQETLKITNRSDYILSYVCMKNEHVYYDFKDKVKLATAFYNLKESEATKCAKLIRYDVLSSVEHERVYTRIFYDEVQSLVADEQLFFHNTHFSISPVKGNLWPNKTTEMTITFSPKQIGELEAIVYLDIDGVADRLPLKLLGTSLPPTIHLNVETLNMDCVYINKKYNYEIVAINRGHIDGEIVHKNAATLFESKITCTPECRFLRPGNKDTFIVSFSNSNPGPFFEEINFFIRDTEVILKVYLKGEVIYPSILFSVSSLDFGDVSLGVPKTLILDVINESNVEVEGIIKIPSDGWEINSITLSDYAAADRPKPQIPKWPKEFSVEPSKIKIGAETAISLKITLTSNLIRQNQTALELEFEKSDKQPITLPVRYNAMVPQITPLSDIQLRACFLDYPYVNEICISSIGFHGYFTIEEPKSSNIDVTINITEGFIEPNSKICLLITIKATALGDFEFPLRLHLFGVPEPHEVCRIQGYGISPIVTCNPAALHCGQVQLLRRVQKTLTLCNDSPVQVAFKTLLLSHDCKWQIEPREGVIEPESEKNLIVSLYLVDAETYTNKVVIHLENMKDILVPLTVIGVGTSIVVGELSDRIELGHHFTKIPLNCKLVMENRGTRLHALEWSEHYKTPKNKQNTTAFFNLEPRSFKMNAGEKIDMTITAISNKEALIKEIWYLVGSIEGVNKKELLLECKITAEFVDPKIELFSNVMEFRYDNGPYNEFYKLTDLLIIKNISTLPLDLEINTRPPFALIQCQNTCKILPHEEDFCHCIYFKDSALKSPTIVGSDTKPESNKLIDFVTLQSLQPVRQGSLHFFEDINKIKRAFNLTYSVEQHLEDQEIMKIQILFDTTKHTSLKSRIYSDSMKIKFKGHKNKVSEGH